LSPALTPAPNFGWGFLKCLDCAFADGHNSCWGFLNCLNCAFAVDKVNIKEVNKRRKTCFFILLKLDNNLLSVKTTY
jgi:hypothetical protein